jgi:hypothetical protein
MMRRVETQTGLSYIPHTETIKCLFFFSSV